MIRKLFSVWLLAALSIAHAATTTPVQLLNPAGSTSGQAIVSTGPSTAPAWGNVSGASLASQAANTALANFTGSSASPTAYAMPSCSVSGSALLYTNGTGITCGSGFAMTSGATFTGAITPSQTAGIVGTTTNNSANAGSVGEYVSATSTATSITNNTPTNLTSISLTAGDWDVVAVAVFQPQTGDTMTLAAVAPSSSSATFPAIPFYAVSSISAGTGTSNSQLAPTTRFSLASTTTIYLVVQGNHGGGTLNATGFIRARRVR